MPEYLNEYPPLEDDSHIPAFDAEAARITLDDLQNPLPPQPFIVERLLPCDCGILNAPGGTGKSSVMLYEAVHIITGQPLYNRKVNRAGAVLYCTQEDSRAKLLYRLNQICTALDLSPLQMKQVADYIFCEDMTTRRTRFVESDERGNLTPTRAVDDLIDQYQGKGLALIVIDPLVFFSPGERHVNDGASELMLTGRRISSALDCCVQFVHHTSIQTARDKTDDQYAGRGASAFADNARFVRNMWVYAADDKDRFGSPPPEEASEDDIKERRLLVMKQPKISDASPEPNPIWLLRSGWAFERLSTPEISRSTQEITDARRLLTFIQQDERREVFHTKRSVETACTEVGLPRRRIQTLWNLAEQKGWITEIEIEEGSPLRHGRRTHRLSVVSVP